MEALQAMIQKHEEARIVWQNEMIAKEKADAAAAAAAKAKDEEEKKKMEEIADATKKAKEAAEKKAEEAAKKAKDEADKKFKELEEAKEEALKKQKELEAETEKLKPPDHTGKSIKFKDAVGRKFQLSLPSVQDVEGYEDTDRTSFRSDRCHRRPRSTRPLRSPRP